MIKKFAISMIIIIVVLIIAGVLFFKLEKATAPANNSGSKKPENIIYPVEVKEPVDEVAKQQVYKNEKYGIEFEYPNDWKLETTEKSFGTIFPITQINCAERTTKTICLDSIIYEIKENKEKFSINNYLKNQGWREGEDYKDLVESKISNAKIFNFIIVNAYDGSEDKTMWVELPDGNFFALQGSYLIENENAVFEKILESVKI